ncbi:MAG: hypothetical protein NC920_03010 [Candidatus Omnitrophica bacterium]|nr:hypothetical protein [Candidatus Omnitrophota bacterium]MCM8798552.1 hypothetical protein [Candidatus Omnitrophota bacterium]
MRKLNFLLIIILILIIIFLLRLPRKEKKYLALQREVPPPQKIQEESPSVPVIPEETPKPKEKAEMKVNFYAIDREKAEKGEFLGTAELREGKLIINVTDQKLKEILEQPYSTMAGEVKEGTAVDWLVTYQPGTIEHLRAIAVECWQFGYIGEIVE